jgi:hypothetical protein
MEENAFCADLNGDGKYTGIRRPETYVGGDADGGEPFRPLAGPARQEAVLVFEAAQFQHGPERPATKWGPAGSLE